MVVDGASTADFYNQKTNLAPDSPPEPTNGSSQQSSSTAFRTDDYSTDCPTPVRITRRIEHVKSGGLLDWTIQIDCQKKSCPRCGPRLYNRHVEHFIAELEYRQDLKYVTLTIDPKIGVKPWDSRDFVVNTWKKHFYGKLYDRTKRQGDSLLYMAAVEYAGNGYAHLHLVISTPLPGAVIRQLWFECGGGIAAEVEPITSRFKLEEKIRYCLKNAFNTPWNDGPDDKGRRSIFNSTGIGYYSAGAKERRLRAARVGREMGRSDEVENALRELGEYQDVLADALSTAAGEDVVLPDGRTGVLLSWNRYRAHVLVDGREETFGPLEVEPEGFEQPLRLVETITPWSVRRREPAVSNEDRVAQKKRFEQIRMNARTTTYTDVRSDGSRVRWTYNQNTGQMTEEVLSRSVGSLDT
jgi:hypothetical protein